MKKLQAFIRSLSPQTWKQLALSFGLFLVPAYLFVELAEEVRGNETLRFDEALLRSINTISSPALDTVVTGYTQLGGPIGAVVITAGIIALFMYRRMMRRAALLTLGVGGAALINLFLKSIFQRDRPHLWERLVTENSYSFPSGHAMASSALALSMLVLFWPTRWRWLSIIVAGFYMVSIGFTRLYLGVHYPTDIVAGWLVSAAWVAVVVSVVRYRARLAALFSRR